jgi:hypothetical protein
MQCLNTVKSHLQIRSQLDVFEIDGNDVLSLVEGEVDFPVTVVGFERSAEM